MLDEDDVKEMLDNLAWLGDKPSEIVDGACLLSDVLDAAREVLTALKEGDQAHLAMRIDGLREAVSFCEAIP